jgi:hypothetical protein
MRSVFCAIKIVWASREATVVIKFYVPNPIFAQHQWGLFRQTLPICFVAADWFWRCTMCTLRRSWLLVMCHHGLRAKSAYNLYLGLGSVRTAGGSELSGMKGMCTLCNMKALCPGVQSISPSRGVRHCHRRELKIV